MSVDMDRFLQDLREHPMWRDELRRLLVPDAFMAVGGRLDRLDDGLADERATLHALVAASQAQQDTLVQQQATLAQQQATLAQQHDTLAQKQATLDRVARVQEANSADLAVLIKAVSHLSDRTGWLEGVVLEQRYERKGFACFQRIAKKLHAMQPDELLAVLDEAVASGAITDDEADDVRLADVVLRGRRGDEELWLVVEVSYTVDTHDVERAVKRSGILARTGRRALPVVAGKRVHVDADAAIAELGVWRVVNGRVEEPPPR